LLNIERFDARHEGENRTALANGGGKARMPCLKIVDQARLSQRMQGVARSASICMGDLPRPDVRQFQQRSPERG
jgi:hypothetical protein